MLLSFIDFIDYKLNKRCPRLGMQGLCVHALVQTQWEFYLHIDEDNRTMKHSYGTKKKLQIDTHKILHFSAVM